MPGADTWPIWAAEMRAVRAEVDEARLLRGYLPDADGEVLERL